MHLAPFVATIISLTATATAAVIQRRIVGGTAVKQNELPFIGQYRVGDDFACSGFLVGPQTFMFGTYNTPFLPVKFELPGDKHVLLNNVKLGEGLRAEVVKTIAHPGYKRLSYVNDIGLVFLASKVASPTVNIGGPYPQANSKIMAAGYGYINEGQTDSNGLNKVELNVASVDACKAHQEGFQSDIQFCTKDIPLGHATCTGDSGGPLWVDMDGAPRMVGIVSHASGEHQCGGKDSYGYFTYITPFIPWINDEIAKFENEQKNNSTMPTSGED